MELRSYIDIVIKAAEYLVDFNLYSISLLAHESYDLRMEIDNNKIVEILRSIDDPATGVDMIRSKRVSNFRINGKKIYFELNTDSWSTEHKLRVNQTMNEQIQTLYPDASLHIHMTGGAGNNTQKSTPLPHVKNVLAVASGKGGVGKSTVSVNLALSLQQLGFRVGLLDADLYGPSVPTMMNMVGERPQIKEVYGKHKLIPIHKQGIHVMSIGFIVEPEKAVVLRGPRLGGIIKQFINDCVWPELDYLIVDLPPGTGDIQLTLVQSIPLTGAIMVTTPQTVAYADALKAMNMFRLENINVPILGVVENMSWFTPAELPDNKYFIFGQGAGERLAVEAKSTLLAKLPLVQSVQEAGDQGWPIAMQKNHPVHQLFLDLAEATKKSVKERHSSRPATEMVKITTS